MAKKRLRTRFKTLVVFVAYGALGLVASLFVASLASQLRALASLYYPRMRPEVAMAIQAMEPMLSQSLVGLVLVGMGGYVVFSLGLSGFARSVLSDLVDRLREQDLLPYHFESQRSRRTLLAAQEGVHELFDAYVIQLKTAQLERAKFQAALGSYADPTVAEKLRSGAGTGNIKSERRAIAVLFSDIRGFTTMSEKLEPEQVVMILNDYFAFSTAAISAQGGKVNKFIGDAVMAIFEEPPAYKEDTSAPRQAINAALAMQEEFSRHLPQWKERIPQVFDCNLGVGVHYGEAVLGNLGSAGRMEYTAIGDTVNFASRLCSLAKPGQVRVSEDCFERVQEHFLGEQQEPVAVKCKTGLHATYLVSRKRFGIA